MGRRTIASLAVCWPPSLAVSDDINDQCLFNFIRSYSILQYQRNRRRWKEDRALKQSQLYPFPSLLHPYSKQKRLCFISISHYPSQRVTCAVVIFIIIINGIENIVFHFRLRSHHCAAHPQYATTQGGHHPLQKGSGDGEQNPEGDGRMSCN